MMIKDNIQPVDDYDLIDKDPEEFKRRGMEAYSITKSQLSVVTPYEIHSILIPPPRMILQI